MDVLLSTRGKGAYHDEFCPYVKLIPKKYLKTMDDRKARQKGYHECRFCSSVRGIVYKYKKTAPTNMKGLRFSYDPIDQAVCVRTNVGFWKIIWKDNCQDWYLFHMNGHGYKSFDPERSDRDLMRGSFHRQKDFKPTESVAKTLYYIIEHDKCRAMGEDGYKKMPTATPRQRFYRGVAKARKKKAETHRVYQLIDELKAAN